MNKKISVAVFAGLAAIFVLWQLLCLGSASQKKVLQEADSAYFAGEKASNLAERQTGFNKALQDYLQLEKNNQPVEGNGKLYFNIGNSFFQLENYPWAILYYYRAAALRPRDIRVEHNLDIAAQKAKVPIKKESSAFNQILGWHFFLSQPERLQIFSLLTIAFFLLLSLQFWQPHPLIKMTLVGVSIPLIFITASLLYSRYAEPIQGVIVQAAPLFRDAGKQYAKVMETPVPGGTKVEVLDVVQKGEWLWIKTPEGTLGYVPQDSIRII